MIDADKVFDDLQTQARRAVKEFDSVGVLGKAIEVTTDIRDRIKSDPQARTAAAGVGSLLLIAMIGSRGGRRFIGNVAQAGAVAALGALAYKAWMGRHGKAVGDNPVKEAAAAGFPIDTSSDPEFALAIIRVMLAAAYADGGIEAHERNAVDSAMAKANLTDEERAMLKNELPAQATMSFLAAAAKTPNHAAELYAAAAAAAGDLNVREATFLANLAEALGLNSDEAAAIRMNFED